MQPARTILVVAVTTCALIALPAAAAEAEVEVGVGGLLAPGEVDAEAVMAEQHFTTGLDINWLWSNASEDEGGKLLGPGLEWGLVLVPEKLELELTIHSLVGGKVNSVPIDLIFKVPFRIGTWFVPYIGVGPMLIFDRGQNRTVHDFAMASALGFALNLPGFTWRLFVEGNYNFRFWQETVHQGGLTIGFQYRF